MPEKLRVGIVGCGAIARIRHIPAFLKLKDQVQIHAVCDKNESLAKEAAANNGVPGVYSDVTQMLAKEKLDIIDICTPPQSHAAIAIEAIKSGCHLILEKPMALSSADCDKMLAIPRKNAQKICVIHNQLYYPPVLKARKLVSEGAIGDFIGLRIFMSDPQDEMIMRKDYWVHQLPGGVIGETGPHPVYKSIAFIGPVVSADVSASRHLEHPWAPFDEFRINLEGQKGYSSIVISYSSHRRASTMDILGTEGALHLDLLSMLLIHHRKNAEMKPIALALTSLGNAAQMLGGITQNAFRLLTGQGEFYGHNTIIKDFVSSITNNSVPPITGEEGRETTRTLEMVVNKLREKYGTR